MEFYSKQMIVILCRCIRCIDINHKYLHSVLAIFYLSGKQIICSRNVIKFFLDRKCKRPITDIIDVDISQVEHCQLSQRHHLSSRLRRLYISNQLKTIKIAAAAIGRPIAVQPLLYTALRPFFFFFFFSFFPFLSLLVYESTRF